MLTQNALISLAAFKHSSTEFKIQTLTVLFGHGAEILFHFITSYHSFHFLFRYGRLIFLVHCQRLPIGNKSQLQAFSKEEKSNELKKKHNIAVAFILTEFFATLRDLLNPKIGMNYVSGDLGRNCNLEVCCLNTLTLVISIFHVQNLSAKVINF